MAGLKEIKIRIASVQSTQQLTSAMKMVSASKLRKSQEKLLRLRFFTRRLAEMYTVLNNAILSDPLTQIYLMGRNVPNPKILVVVIASNRGLCGAFNSNICKYALQRIEEIQKDPSASVELMCLGNKAIEFFKHIDVPKVQSIEENFSMDTYTYKEVYEVANELSHKFYTGVYDQVEVVYYHAVNAMNYVIQQKTLFPFVNMDEDVPGIVSSDTSLRDLEFKDVFMYPNPKEVMDRLFPMMATVNLFYMLAENSTAEHGARMMAMGKASDSADALLKTLRLTYNNLRQAGITNELLEIVSGANALNG